MRSVVYVALAVTLTSVTSARTPDGEASPQTPAFRAGVDVVGVNVTATDGSRHFVTDLVRDDFHVLEDGRPQQITYFRQTGVSLAVALLIDTSASMDASLPLAQEAAIGLVRELGIDDVASIVDFDSRVQILQAFTRDRVALERAIARTTAGGSTALYNAVYIALKELGKTLGGEALTEPRRRAIIVLSDGEDTSSLIGFDEVLNSAARSDTAIYAIGLLGRDLPEKRKPQDADFVLRRLAQQTGGRAFFPMDAKELGSIYREIRAELASQYFLAYESDNPRRDGQFRHIAVRIDRPGVVARARPGYYAPTR